MDNQESAARGSRNTQDEKRVTHNPQPNDIYQDPALADDASSAEGLKDPVQELIFVWWKQIVYAILAVLGLTYFVTTFKEAHEESLQASADFYSTVLKSFTDYENAYREYSELASKPNVPELKSTPAAGQAPAVSDQQGKLDAAKKKMELSRESYKRLLTDSANQMDEPYKELRALFEIKEARLEGRIADLSSKLADADKWSTIADQDSFERLQAELLALATARGLVDSSEFSAKGMQILEDLALKSNFVAVPAAIAYSELAASAEDRKTAFDTLKGLSQRQPEQAELLRDHLTRLESQVSAK